MATIRANVDEHILELTQIDIIPSGNVHSDFMYFTFSEEWDEYNKRAVFYTSIDNKRIEMELVNDNEEYYCNIPAEILKEKCKAYVGVIGTSADITYTSTLVVFDVPEGARAGEESEISVPDIYQQMQWLNEILNNSDEDINKTVGSLENKYNYYMWTTGICNLIGLATPKGVQDYTVAVTCKKLNLELVNAKIYGLEPESADESNFSWGDGENLARYNLSVIWDGENYIVFICAYEVEA